MLVIIDIYSKNILSLDKFFKFFINEKIIKKLKITFINVYSQQPRKKKVLTVLKSPHVNKIAQDQFEFNIYKKRLKCFIPQFSLFLIFLKKLNFNFFSEIKVKIRIISNLNFERKKLKNNFNVNNYKLVSKKLNLVNYLNVCGIYGEFVLKSKIL